MIRTVLLVAAAALALSALPGSAHGGCSIEAASLGEDYARAEVVFIGRAIEITPVQAMVDDRNGKRTLTETHARFEVIEILKGAPASTLLTKSEYGRHDCHVEFTPGAIYVVFAIREPRDGSLRVRLGGPTALVTDAGAALVYCRRVTATGKGPSLIGTVRAMTPSAVRGEQEPFRAVPDVVVSIDVNGEQREARTDNDGVYYVDDLPVGSYSMRVKFPEGYRLQRATRQHFFGHIVEGADGAFEIEIKEGVKAAMYFEVSNAGTLSGKLVDETGAPFAGASILLASKARPTDMDTATWVLQMESNARGEFRSGVLPEDDYEVVVNPLYFDAYVGKAPRFVFPPPDSGSAPKLARVRNGRHLEMGVIRMPQPFTSVPLDIQVAGSTRSAGDYWITCTSIDGARAVHEFGLDDSGHVRIHLRAGLRFRIEVSIQDDENSSSPVEIEAKPGLEPIRFEVRAAPPGERAPDNE